MSRKSIIAAAARQEHHEDNVTAATQRTTARILVKRSFLAAVGALAVITVPAGLAGAHNAAHVLLPDGTCLDVGSNKDAPIVGAANPNQSPGSNNMPGQLDLIPGNGDQYGARYAADHSPQLLPGDCP